MRALVIISLLLAGCASQPPAVSYADIQAKYQSQRIETAPVEYKPRAMPTLHQCGELICMSPADFKVSEEDKERFMEIIKKMNEAITSLANAANNRLDAIAHCEYAGLKKDEAIVYLEQARDKTELTGMIKQLATAGTCGLLLWAQ